MSIHPIRSTRRPLPPPPDFSISLKKVNDTIIELLTNENPNKKLAGKILSCALEESKSLTDGFVKDVFKFVASFSFYDDPVEDMLGWLISRGVGGARLDDSSARFVIKHIPNFVEEASSLETLKRIANKRYQNRPDGEVVLKCFNQSLESPEFKKDFALGVEALQQGKTTRLAAALYIFTNSENCQSYSFPHHSYGLE